MTGMAIPRHLPEDASEEMKRCNWEATWFARSMLMPRKEFTEIFNACKGNIREVAMQCRLTQSVVTRRAKELGLMEDGL